MDYSAVWNELKNYIKSELERPGNSDDIPQSILEDILYKMESLEENK